MQHSADYKNEWVWSRSPNLADLAPGADAFEKELDLLGLDDILALPTNLGLPGSTELLFTEIRGGYAPGPTSAITASSDSFNSCDSLDTLSAYSAADSSFHAYAGLGALSDALQGFDLNTIGATLGHFATPATPTAESAAADQQLRLLMDQQLEQAPPTTMDPTATHYPPASSHPSVAAGPVQLPTLPAAYTAATTTSRTSLSPSAVDDDLNDRGDADPRKKYTCPKCDRRFARAFNLKTHIATHDPNRVKSFKCRHPGCGRSFSRKHDLGRHLVSIHQDHDSVDAKPVSSAAAIGVGATKAGSAKGQRVWCDGCGRGWVKGSGQECACSSDESSVGEHP